MKLLSTTHALSALTPVSLHNRAAAVYGERVAVVDGRLAGAVIDDGLRPGARVAVLSHHTREMLEALYAVPYAAGVLVPINYTSGTIGMPKGAVYCHRGQP